MTSPHHRTRDGHLDELLLVGWAEGRLLDFERGPVEEHLADCRACRDLVAGLTEDEAGAVRTSPPSPLRILRPALLAAAALLVAFFFLWDPASEGPPASFELALADSREAVFQELRGDPADLEQVFVGLRLTESGWLRLVAVDDRGGIEPIPLDPAGNLELALSGDTDHVFGPYPTRFGADRSLVAVVALLSREPLPWSGVEESGWNGSLAAPDLRDLRDGLGARVRVRRVR